MKILSRSITVAFLSAAAWLSADIAPGDAGWPTAYPEWWYHAADPANGVIDATLPVLNQNNDAPLALGQLKHIASEARDELDAQLAAVGGAGSAIDSLVDGFTTVAPSNLSPANIGQLKEVSSVFYNRLAEVGFTPSSTGWPATLILDEGAGDNATNYPWRENVTPGNAALANIGQAKNLFSWDLTFVSPPDPDADSDGDWLTDAEEAIFGSNPNLVHSDSDSLTDYQEFHAGTDPNLANTVSTDTTGAAALVVWRHFR